MRYLYVVILALAALAYPAMLLHAMERTPNSDASIEMQSNNSLERLQTVKEHYEALAQKGGWPAFQVRQKKIEPGHIDSRVDTLRAILLAMGDHKEKTAQQPTLYDEKLVESVQRFQRRHGLSDDGVIGRETQLALAVPVEKRLSQIKGTIKRAAEFSPELQGKAIVINLPEYVLRTYSDGQETGEMKVVVGTPKDQTPQFTRNMTYVSFNPHWGVPIRIAAEEMLPKIIEDPEFFTKQDFALYELTADGRTEIQPETVDWSIYNKDHFPFLLRQRPGKGNALGKIKFGLKDSNAIYLHDTSAPKFFSRDVRAFSHGCIRVEKPYELAKFVFDGHEKITPERFDGLYNGTDSRIISIPAIPVHTVYWSAWADSEGTAHFRKDIYNQD